MNAPDYGSAARSVEASWWEHFFEGIAVQHWLTALSPEYTNREADTIIRLLCAAPGAELLDVPCGAGRLSLNLAERGYRLTGVDWSPEFLRHARANDGADRVRWERREMRDLPWSGRFDGAFCMGNSFGYLDDDGNAAFLRAVAAALKPGARFVLETPMILENLFGHLQERPWWKTGDIYLLVSNEYDHIRRRLESEYTFLWEGRCEVRHVSHRVYKYAEVRKLIEAAGFEVGVAAPWTPDAHSVTFVATRTSNIEVGV